MERNRLTITTESRILGDEYVRFGGEYIETCSPKKGARRIVLSHWGSSCRGMGGIAKVACITCSKTFD